MQPPFATMTDATQLGFTVTESDLTKASIRIRRYLRSANQPISIPNPDDELIELTCAIAQRLSGVDDNLVAGVQQEAAGPFSHSYGWDAWRAVTGLATGELQELRRLYPPLPGIVIMQAPAGPDPVHPEDLRGVS